MFKVTDLDIVELKSDAHPDTLCDLIVDACAEALEQYYISTYGTHHHFNIDKAMISAGKVEIDYGGGKVLVPPTFILGGQVSDLDGNRALLRRTIRATIRKHLPNLKRLRIEIRCNGVSQNLKSIAQSRRVLCNDTSFGVGYAPMTDGDMKVLALRDAMDALIRKGLGDVPAGIVGENYKIMFTPRTLTISAPIYAKQVQNKEEYAEYKRRIEFVLSEVAKTPVVFNPDFDSGFPWLTLTGSAIEAGDDGQVGRGNRANGLITPLRPMTLEAVSGKNSFNHIGRIYTIRAFQRAEQIYRETGKAVGVVLVGRIGKPLDELEEYVVDAWW